MSNSENVCVGCKHSIADETMKGDFTLRHDAFRIEFEETVVGARSGCRNCALILDAITTSVGNEHPNSIRKSFWILSLPRNQQLTIMLGDGIEIFRSNYHPQGSERRRLDIWNVKELRALSGDTSSQQTFRVIQDWRTSCMEHHEQCMQRVVSPLPKRILEIEATRIYLREQPSSPASYACLSHCWGPHGPALQLKADTLEYLNKGFVTSDLPQTFRDAVEVCRRLQIHYIWIDALCILQDNEEDWKEAAATMASIYENSHITIAATASQDSDGGLFSHRPAVRRLNKHPYLCVRTSIDSFPIKPMGIPPNSMPLLTRAWVYQERRLSTRTIHFGKGQVYWECQSQFASEDAGEDRIWRTHGEDRGHFWEVDWGDKTLNANKHWQKMVMEYTALRLTYESDRLPAIAALVERTSKLRKADDVYISGMWKNSILADLLWELNWKSRRPRPTQMVPSWSWASTQSLGIMWDSTIKFPERTKVVSLEYTAIGAANLGKVTDASITLSVTVLNLTAVDELVPADINGLNNHERFEDIFMSTSFEQLFRQYGLSVKSSAFKNDYDLTTANPPNIYGRNIKLLVARYRDVYMSGIVIQRTSKNAEKYERIGFLSVCMETTKPGVLEQNDGDLEEGDEYRQAKIEETKEGIDSLIMALPMEEVKIV